MHSGEVYMSQVALVIAGQSGGNTTNQFQFTQQDLIRYARILAIEVIPRSAQAYWMPKAIQTVADSDLSKFQLTLETNDPLSSESVNSTGRFSNTLQTIKGIALTSLNRLQNQATNNASFARQLTMFYNHYVTWEKSFVQLPSGGLGNTSDLALILQVHYTWRNIEGKIIQRT